MSNSILRKVNSRSELKDKINGGLFIFFGEKYRDARIDKYLRYLKINDIVMIINVFIGYLCAVIAAENNVQFNFPNPRDPRIADISLSFDYNSTAVTVNRAIVTATTVLLIICLIINYILILKIDKYKLDIRYDSNLISSGYYKFLSLELLLNIVHTPPLVNGFVEVTQRNGSQAKVNIDYILTICLLFGRSYQILKFIALNSSWYDHKIEKICLACNTPLNFMFSLKAEFKQNPFRLVLTTMGVSIFIFGYSVRSIEMFFMGGSNTLDWRYFWNGMWCVIITMSTVGFGDFYPISTLGRTIIVIACFWGTFLISLMVAALSLTVEFNSQEETSYQSIKEAHFELEYGTLATKLIQRAVRYYWHVRTAADEIFEKDQTFRRKKSRLFSKLKIILQQFRRLRKNKDENFQSMIISMSLNKIDNNITVEVDKIKEQIVILERARNMLEEYNLNQKIIKQKSIALFTELEEMNSFREKYLKEISEER